MKTSKPAPRHRLARRPLTDTMVEGLNASTAARPIAFASAAGVALTAIAAGVANAAPATPQSEPQSADLNTTTVAVDDVTTVEVPDIAWTAEEDATASATADRHPLRLRWRVPRGPRLLRPGQVRVRGCRHQPAALLVRPGRRWHHRV